MCLFKVFLACGSVSANSKGQVRSVSGGHTQSAADRLLILFCSQPKWCFRSFTFSVRVSGQAGIISETIKACSQCGWHLQLQNNEATHHIKCDINCDTLQRQTLATEGLMLTFNSEQCYFQSNFWVVHIFVEGANIQRLLLLICIYSGDLLIRVISV